MKNYLLLATVMTGCLIPLLAVVAVWLKSSARDGGSAPVRSWRLGLHDLATGRYLQKDFYAALVLGRDTGLPEPEDVLYLSEDYTVSRQQCRLTAVGADVWAENLSQVNETVLNGVPLATPRRLRQGDSLLVGRREFRVSLLEPR